MKTDQRIEQIIEMSGAAISNGQETIASILEKYPQLADELRPALEAAVWLASAKKSVEPRADFITSSRGYLEDQIQALQPHGWFQRMLRRHSPGRWAFNFASPAILALLLLLIVHNLVLTARLSIPEEPLYSTKLLLEDVQLAFTFNQADKTNNYIQFSRERISEFVVLLLEGDYEILPAAANRMEIDMIASLRSIESLSNQDIYAGQSMAAEMKETLSNEILILNTLQGSSPASAHPGIELAINVAQTGLMVLR